MQQGNLPDVDTFSTHVWSRDDTNVVVNRRDLSSFHNKLRNKLAKNVINKHNTKDLKKFTHYIIRDWSER